MFKRIRKIYVGGLKGDHFEFFPQSAQNYKNLILNNGPAELKVFVQKIPSSIRFVDCTDDGFFCLPLTSCNFSPEIFAFIDCFRLLSDGLGTELPANLIADIWRFYKRYLFLCFEKCFSAFL